LGLNPTRVGYAVPPPLDSGLGTWWLLYVRATARFVALDPRAACLGRRPAHRRRFVRFAGRPWPVGPFPGGTSQGVIMPTPCACRNAAHIVLRLARSLPSFLPGTNYSKQHIRNPFVFLKTVYLACGWVCAGFERWRRRSSCAAATQCVGTARTAATRGASPRRPRPETPKPRPSSPRRPHSWWARALARPSALHAMHPPTHARTPVLAPAPP
jgi:hypothetical protein